MLFIPLYHSIARDDNYLHSISPGMFRWQVSYLKDKHRIINTRTLQESFSKGKELDANISCIHFDDGYLDNYQEAFPILKELNICATIFVSTDYVGKVFNNRKMMSWDHLQEMEESGLIDIQSHTNSHAILTDIPESNMRKEFEVSSDLLRKRLGPRKTSIAYPKSRTNYQVQNIAKEYFELGFGGSGVLLKQPYNRYEIPRVTITRNTPKWKFRLYRFKPLWSFRNNITR